MESVALKRGKDRLAARTRAKMTTITLPAAEMATKIGRTVLATPTPNSLQKNKAAISSRLWLISSRGTTRK